MDLEVLVSAMHRTDLKLCSDMNIRSNALIINQCDRTDEVFAKTSKGVLRMISTTDRGVGVSRNCALMNSTAEYCLFADDDIIYDNNYVSIIADEFLKYPKAEAMLFNLNSLNPNRPVGKVNKDGKLHWWNTTSCGAPQLVVKRKILLEKNIKFSTLFGGGCEYSCGEDSVFIQDLFKNGVRVYGSTRVIADARQDSSTWFEDYNDKYFFDKGALYAAMFGKKAKFMLLKPALHMTKMTGRKFGYIYKCLISGMNSYNDKYS